MSLKLRYVSIALVLDVVANRLEIIATFVPPNVHAIFQGKKCRDRVVTNDWGAHQPGEKVPCRDVVSEAFISREMLRSMKVEVGFVGLGRTFLLSIGGSWEGRYEGFLHQRSAS